jgi:hypothetical protein
MAEQTHSVIYRAVAQFDDARKKAKEFRDELKALKTEQEGLSKSATAGASQQEQAERRVTSATKDHTEATKQTIRATREATEEVKKLGDESDRTSKKFRSIQSIGKNFGNEFSKALGALANDMRKAWKEAEAGETVFQKLRRAMSAAGGGGNSGNFFTTLAGGADSLGRSLTRVLSRFTFWPTIILAAAAAAGPLVAILGSLGGVALAANSALISLAGSVAALPGLIFAAAAGIGALVTAITPIAGALKAYTAAQEASGAATKRSSRAQEDQAQQIRNASRALESAQRSVINASRGIEEANRDVERATRGVVDAEYELVIANREAKRAQEDVNEAREDALRDLQDLRREVERSGLNEERAVLNLVRAQQEYAKVVNDPTASLLDRREALLRLREAENDLEDVRRRNVDNAKELAEAEAKGVENSDKVVDAKEAAEAATKRQKDAEYQLIEAQRALVNANRQVAEAEYRLVEARRNVVDAELNLARAHQGVAEGSGAAATARDKYQAALEKLSPSARKVLATLISMKEGWKEVSKAVQEAVFQPVVGQLDNLASMLPVVENLLVKAGAAIGEVAAKGIAMVSSGPWKKDFADQAKANAVFIKNIGEAGLFLLDALRNITRAAEPFTTWLTSALKQGAANFREWAESARNNGDIERFLEVTKRRLQEVWQIVKNVGGTLLSWGKAAQPFTDWMLGRLIDITARWREVARAQESATSPLQKWLQDIKPLLSSVAHLFGDIGRGFAEAASDTKNIERAIDLLESLRTDVIPALSRVLHELGESGVDQAIVDAIAEILDAIANFLDSGGGQALSTFVTVLAGFVSVLASIVALPGVGHIIGGIATALAAVAAVSIVARFTGLFKLVDAFRWFVANRGNLTGALADAARGLAGVQGQRTDNVKPSSVIGPIGSELSTENSINRTGTAAGSAAPKVGIFNRALSGMAGAGGTARRALGGLSDFIGGPWGIALIAATAVIGIVASDLEKQRKSAEDTKNAWNALAGAYDELKEGSTTGTESLVRTDEKFRDIAESAKTYGISLTDLSGALNNNEQANARVNDILDRQAAALKEQYERGEISRAQYNVFKLSIDGFRGRVTETAQAQEEANNVTDDSIALSRTYEQRLGGLTQQQVDNATSANSMESSIRLLSGALDVMASATATNTEKSKALGDIINYETGAMQDANEATENWNSQLLSLKESVEANGKSLSVKTREGLRNRDAMQEAAKATRDLFLQDIASGVPMTEATKRHEDRIKALREEARRLGLNKTETEKLIAAYGKVPDKLTTDVTTDTKGFQSVYVELLRLQVMQEALKRGLSPEQAQQLWIQESSKLYRRPPSGDGPGFKEGGPVYGPGTRNSDSIRAWLSNGEFVQPTDTVEHYGVGIMEAMRHRKLDKAVLQEALPSRASGFNRGGMAHGSSCSACASGNSHNFAEGGLVVPIKVNPSKTLVDQDWLYSGIGGGPLGNESGPGGWRWQMQVLRQRFPGLPLWSGYRPGSTTLSGNRSYHAIGRAVDIPPRRDVAQWIRDNYGSRTKELITPFNDINLHNGKPHRYTGAVWNQHNFRGGNAHDHWAYRQGGLVDLSDMFGFPGMDSSRMLSNAAMPNASSRQLSAAAQSVINQNRGITVENLNVNNPIPERASDSLSRQVTKLAVLGDI